MTPHLTAHIPLPCNNVLPNASEDLRVVLILSGILYLLIWSSWGCLQKTRETIVSSMLTDRVSSLHVWCWWSKYVPGSAAGCSSLCCSQFSCGVLLWLTEDDSRVTAFFKKNDMLFRCLVSALISQCLFLVGGTLIWCWPNFASQSVWM